MPSKSVIFDLDGTLIDSQESILHSIKIALSDAGIASKIPITKELVGPPLMDTLSKISGINHQPFLNELAKKFKRHYDDAGYKGSIEYPGIGSLLKQLKSQGYSLYIATNKRLIPTQKIINHFSWNLTFSAAYCIDSNSERPFKNKAEMISALIANEGIDRTTAVYIGDRLEDQLAAAANGIRSIAIQWGYGGLDIFRATDKLVATTAELIKIINSDRF